MAFKLGMTVDFGMAYIYMLMVVSITFTLMQGHSGALIKLAAMVGPFFIRDLDFANVCMACQFVVKFILLQTILSGDL